MKVYLEEKDMPKDCVNCDFGYANNFCEIDYELDLRKFDKNQKHPKCPLESLADYTKQVRKEVCEEIAKKMENKLVRMQPDGEFGTRLAIDWYDINKVLDQIQGDRQ